MDNNSKRSIIGKHIDISGCHLKEDEANQLLGIIKDIASLAGRNKTYKRQFTDWSSDGKYTRIIETTYTLLNENGKIFISEDEKYWDDDGGSGKRRVIHTAAREILKLLYKVM